MASSKRPHSHTSDMNNNEITSTTPRPSTKRKSTPVQRDTRPYTIGQIKEVHMVNFMCQKNFSIEFHPTPMQIVVGANGSGKSTIANAICLCLGAQARTTGRTNNVQSFIRKGETSAELTITLANVGAEAFKPELYGSEIQIVRRIGVRSSGYKILGETRQVISTRKETIAEIIQALSISPENPLCVLHQEIAKTFLLNSDSKKKYQFYMKVSQLDQMKQAHEEALCIVQSNSQRVDAMKQKYVDFLRRMEPLEGQVKKIEIRRESEGKKHALEAELLSAQAAHQQQELTNIQIEMDQTQRSKDTIEARLKEVTNKIRTIEQRIENLKTDRLDLEKDLQGPNGLRSLNLGFARQKKEIDLNIYRFTNECERFHQIALELQQEQNSLQQRIVEFQTLSQQANGTDEQRLTFDHELQVRQRKQLELDQAVATWTDQISADHETIRTQESTLDCIRNELKQKQQIADELKKGDKDQTSVYGKWMVDCLKAIESEKRFHRKPIGPLGRHIRCISPHWAYAVEKHLAPIMSSFICTDGHDERLLLDLFAQHSHGYRPTVFKTEYVTVAHDISGTLEHIQRANLLSIYQVLNIDNVIVERVLVDIKQIEATILIENMQEAKRLRQSGVLRWQKVHKKVKQVVEAWTYDGSNIKLDKAFRIYTNDRQPARYFLSSNTQSLSIGECEAEIQQASEQIRQVTDSLNTLQTGRRTALKTVEGLKKDAYENKKKIVALNAELTQLNAASPVRSTESLDELEEKLKACTDAQSVNSQKFNEVKDQKEVLHQSWAAIQRNYENIVRKVESKTEEMDLVAEKVSKEQSDREQLQQEETRLTKKFTHLNDDLRKCQEKLSTMSKNRPKKLKASVVTTRSVRDIQQELDATNHFLKANEDTLEQRRQVIDEYRVKRDAAQTLKKDHERALRQLQYLDAFVGKRKERFGVIADQHQYLLRMKFKSLMERHRFDECDIRIDHRREELDIIIKRSQRTVASLSGGERSISTFCFLVALWGSIYQPFRLLDEIDIYMDNEKRNSSLDLLYENAQHYSSSQHVIFTPQAIDPQIWEQRHVPVFRMPTPKRSLQ